MTQHLGDYRVEALLGEGGTARIYAATSFSGQRVALKVLRDGLAQDAAMHARFKREARVTDRFEHDGIVRVIDAGICPDGRPFLAMELLDGESLEARAERKGGRLTLSEVLWAADACLDALAAAHAHGVVHRDIKPDNLFLTRDRRLKVLDFGIAGVRELAQQQESTHIGVVMGTPAFMPPEQARGDWTRVGPQTDLWSVGAMMYTLLSGRLVHEETQLFEQLYAATSRPAHSLAHVAPHLPPVIVQAVDHALAFEPSSRWPTARAMQRALRFAYAEWRRDLDEEMPVQFDDNPSLTDQGTYFQRIDPPPRSRPCPPPAPRPHDHRHPLA